MNFLSVFKGQEKDFYQMLTEQCEETLEGMKHFKNFTLTLNEENENKVIQSEHNADMCRRTLIDELNNTFITPIEREDIYALSRGIDDIIDYARTSVEEIKIYNLEPTEELKEIADLLVKMTEALTIGIKSLKKHKNIASEQAVAAKRLENKIELCYRNSLAKLFNEEDIKYILKMREVYRHLSNCADKGDCAADLLAHIVVKMV